MNGTRPSALAGAWYPADREGLAREVDAYLAAARLPALPGVPLALVVPHAGHRYSGPVAGHGFRCVQALPVDTVVVLGPWHHEARGELLTTAHTAYQTPLGEVEVDVAGLARLDRELRKQAGIGLEKIARDREHSIEIEIPFLQRTLSRFKLLPVMMADQSAATARVLAAAIAHVCRDGAALLVASSDLSHFQPRDTALRLDREMLRRIAAFDPAGVLEAEASGQAFACGRGAIASVLWAASALGSNRVTVLRHATSGEITGDLRSVVGYGAAVATRPGR